MKCHACWQRIDGPYLTVIAAGFSSERMNGVRFTLHPGCIRLVFPPDTSGLEPRVSDPEVDFVEEAASR